MSSGAQRLPNQRQSRPIRQVENEPGGESEDSLEDIQVVKQIGGKMPPLKVCLYKLMSVKFQWK